MNPFSLYGLLGSAAVAALLAVGATHYIDSLSYGIKIGSRDKTILTLQKAAETSRADSAEASIKKLNGFISGIQLASVDFGKNQDLLFGKLDALNRNFRDAVKKNPLPDTCKPDDYRLRVHNEAVDAANSANTSSQHGFGETVSSPRAPDR